MNMADYKISLVYGPKLQRLMGRLEQVRPNDDETDKADPVPYYQCRTLEAMIDTLIRDARKEYATYEGATPIPSHPKKEQQPNPEPSALDGGQRGQG